MKDKESSRTPCERRMTSQPHIPAPPLDSPLWLEKKLKYYQKILHSASQNCLKFSVMY